jgi:hypothetical protein
MSASSPSPVPLEVAGPRSVRAGGDGADGVVPHGRRALAAAHEVLGRASPDRASRSRPPWARTPICGTRRGRAGAWELSTAAAPERRPLRHAWTAACVRRNTPSSATIDVTSACTTLTEVEVGHTVRSCRQVTACTPPAQPSRGHRCRRRHSAHPRTAPDLRPVGDDGGVDSPGGRAATARDRHPLRSSDSRSSAIGVGRRACLHPDRPWWAPSSIRPSVRCMVIWEGARCRSGSRDHCCERSCWSRRSPRRWSSGLACTIACALTPTIA